MNGSSHDVSHMSLDGQEVYTLWDGEDNELCCARLLTPKDDDGYYIINLRHPRGEEPRPRKTYRIKINSDLELAKTLAHRLVAKYSDGYGELMDYLNKVGHRTDLND